MKKGILVVDDEPGLTRLIRLNLEATGHYAVREENRGAQALSAARAFRPDLILLNVMMPDKEGEDVAAEIGEDALLGDIPIVFLTAIVTRQETGPSGTEIAGHTFLAKPVRRDELIRYIEEQLKH